MEGAADGVEVRVSVNGAPLGEPKTVAIGDSLAVGVLSPRAGWLTLFNVGTSGTPTRMLPLRPTDLPPRVKAGEWGAAPGTLAAAERFPCGSWVENGPTTAATGAEERIVAIVADEPWLLSPLAVPNLPVAPRGGIAAVTEEVASLDFLPPGSWVLGEISFSVA